jgi:endonuclease YncB( thermonuclease family)
MVEWTKHDRYGRILGKVMFTPAVCVSPACLERTDANYQQIAAGMAWHYKEYEREQSRDDRDRYAAAESQARAAKRGLWADPAPIPPWEWRHQKR